MKRFKLFGSPKKDKDDSFRAGRKYGCTFSFDFRNPNGTTEAGIDEWHWKVLNTLRESKNLRFTSIASGNSIVIGEKYSDDSITIYVVTNGYRIYCHDALPHKEQEDERSIATKSNQGTET